MNDAPRRADAGTGPRIERLQPWIAALASLLAHALLLLLAWLSPPLTMSTPQGSAAGSRMQVTYIDDALSTPPTDAPPVPQPAPATPAPAPPPASRLQATMVERADASAARDVPAPEDAARTPRPPAPARPPAPPVPAESAASPPPTQRPGHTWGQPPGMLAEDLAPVHAGTARSTAIEAGRRQDASSSQPNLEVGGYQVYYDLSSETRLRAWRDQGMTEVFLPLPGTRQYMVCPLETALRRESGRCRLLAPDSPELADIGDAREVISMHQVYRRGELIWRGPRAYR